MCTGLWYADFLSREYILNLRRWFEGSLIRMLIVLSSGSERRDLVVSRVWEGIVGM